MIMIRKIHCYPDESHFIWPAQVHGLERQNYLFLYIANILSIISLFQTEPAEHN